ncbi:hypothetical protein SNE40_012966 [Patella caerulea]
MGRIPTCIVGDPDLIKEICVKQATSKFPDRLVNSSVPKQLENSMQFLEGEHWKFVRGHISPTFSTGKLKETVPLIHKCCDTLMMAIERLSKTDENIDTKKLFACFSMDIIASISFGMEIDSQDDPNNKFVKHANSLMVNKKAVFIAMVCLIFPFMKKVFAYFNIWGGGNEALDFFERATAAAIEERIKGKQDRKDFLQLMINARKEGVIDPDFKPANPEEWKNRGLTNGEIYANSMLFFVAAYETVSLNLTFLAYSLAINPEIQDELIGEIDGELRGEKPTYDHVFNKMPYLDKVMCESLRLFPPAQLSTRLTREDVTIGGYKFKKGMDIHIPICHLQKNPDFFPEPEVFNPERFTEEEKSKRNPYTYIPFGIGPRSCVGMRLAMLEARVAIVCLLQKYRIGTTEKTTIPVEIEQIGFTRPKGILHLKFEKRSD